MIFNLYKATAHIVKGCDLIEAVLSVSSFKLLNLHSQNRPDREFTESASCLLAAT
ncbi:MAG: hypothetical protein ACOC0N_03995 [Chroococcales cyanobacterium]